LSNQPYGQIPIVMGPTQQTTVVGFSEKPGALAIIFGIITIMISIVILIGSGVGVYLIIDALNQTGGGFSDTGGAGIFTVLSMSCCPALLAFYGIFSGVILTFVGGSAGKVLAAFFWIFLILLGLCIGITFGIGVLGMSQISTG
jgi:hypothetical protein